MELVSTSTVIRGSWSSRYSAWATGWNVRSFNPCRGKKFVSSPKRAEHLLCPTQSPVQWVKRPGSEFNHPPPFSVETKYKWRYNLFSPYMTPWRGTEKLSLYYHWVGQGNYNLSIFLLHIQNETFQAYMLGFQ